VGGGVVHLVHPALSARHLAVRWRLATRIKGLPEEPRAAA